MTAAELYARIKKRINKDKTYIDEEHGHNPQ
jgi:hypothetical protein